MTPPHAPPPRRPLYCRTPKRGLAAALIGCLVFTGLAAAEETGHEAPAPLANLREAAAGVFVGGQPQGAAAYDELAAMGVRTIVCVDGLPPEAALAKAKGIRVVHAPLGYDGVAAEPALTLTRVARDAPRPLYVYCHHGRHRGPAAAAVVCRAAGLLDERGAVDLLRIAGTSPDYAGLWRDVAAYEPPPPGAELPPLVERSETPPVALAMAQLDQAWDAALAAPSEAARRESLIAARQALKESRRASGQADGSPGLDKRFEQAMAGLESLLESGPGAQRGSDQRALADACVDCHAEHRDRIEP